MNVRKLSTRADGLCPCCGQALPPATFQWVLESGTFICGAGSLKFSRAHATIFDFIWSKGGASSLEQITNHVYQLDPNGGPEGQYQTVSVHMSRMRRLLEPLGFTMGGKLDSYRIVKHVPK